jgi:hypothetical protein
LWFASELADDDERAVQYAYAAIAAAVESVLRIAEGQVIALRRGIELAEALL